MFLFSISVLQPDEPNYALASAYSCIQGSNSAFFLIQNSRAPDYRYQMSQINEIFDRAPRICNIMYLKYILLFVWENFSNADGVLPRL